MQTDFPHPKSSVKPPSVTLANRVNRTTSPLKIAAGCLGLLCVTGQTALACGGPPQPQAQTFVGAMNRAQQAYYLEKSAFSSSISDLGLPPARSQKPYAYSIQKKANSVYNLAISRNSSQVSYVGAVFVIPASAVDKRAVEGETTMISILCRSNSAGAIRVLPDYKNGVPMCGTGSTQVYRN